MKASAGHHATRQLRARRAPRDRGRASVASRAHQAGGRWHASTVQAVWEARRRYVLTWAPLRPQARPPPLSSLSRRRSRPVLSWLSSTQRDPCWPPVAERRPASAHPNTKGSGSC